MANYTKTNVGSTPRTELHDTLGLTGAEVSINQLPAGAGVPFVHAHQQNEEIYGILAGKGKAVIDGEEIALTAGDWLKVAPAAKRQFSAAADSSITSTSREVTVLTSSAKGSPSNGISSNALNKKTLQPKMAQTMLLFRRSALRIARAATVIDRFVISL